MMKTFVKDLLRACVGKVPCAQHMRRKWKKIDQRPDIAHWKLPVRPTLMFVRCISMTPYNSETIFRLGFPPASHAICHSGVFVQPHPRSPGFCARAGYCARPGTPGEGRGEGPL